jgi:hypothetical protein
LTKLDIIVRNNQLPSLQRLGERQDNGILDPLQHTFQLMAGMQGLVKFKLDCDARQMYLNCWLNEDDRLSFWQELRDFSRSREFRAGFSDDVLLMFRGGIARPGTY